MSPDYLMKLADLADPDQLWRRAGLDRADFTELQKQQLDTGVALRRHARHTQEVDEAYQKGLSYCITKLGPSHYTKGAIPPPENHQRLIDQQKRHSG
jgi:alanyl-tRNA synthetase